ncbi:MAG: hypothetical protein O3B21_06760 [Proteobacteria bacterium]|nr:hypothetical protein [Pseudomonadota bacterium]MDA1356641.1 hypothetical protein [Pseudomonadota bacterium]
MEESMRAAGTAEITCSLTDEEFRERRAMARKDLLPHILDGERMDSGLRLTFADSVALRSRVESFIRLERQCCGFLTFTLAPPIDGLILTIEGPPEAQITLDRFADAAIGQ